MKVPSVLIVASVLLPRISAAHIQAVPCRPASRHQSEFPQQDFVGPLVLRAQVNSLNGTHDRLSVDAFLYSPGHDGCDEWASKLPHVGVELAMLGRNPVMTWFNLSEVCHSLVYRVNDKESALTLPTDHIKFPELSSFELAVLFLEDNQNGDMFPVVADTMGAGTSMDNAGGGAAACVRSRATPQPAQLTLDLLRYIPMTVLLLVVMAGIVRSMPARQSPLQDDNSAPPPARSILPDVGDCLQHLQFIFFTACLSIPYPGFYQPAVSELRWYSLFGTTLFVDSFQYDGYLDGIYDINGTFGGTYGAEIMTQVVGAPLTIGTWVNMLLCVAIAAIVVAVLLSGLWYVETTKRKIGLLVVGQSRPPLVRNVARVILSYFMFPLVALTVYQFDNAKWLPVSHSTLAGFIMFGTLAAFGWLVWQIPTRSLGALIFDHSKRYRRLDEQHPGGPDDAENDVDLATTAQQHERRDRVFVYILFSAVIIRGCVVGGLQISGMVQVFMLLGCEFIFAACILAFQAYSVLSLGSISAVVRILSLAAMIVFLPGVLSNDHKSIVAYALLGLHALFLVCGFGGSAIWHLVRAAVKRSQRPAGEVYGLRDLQRRPNPRDTPTPTRFSNDDRNHRVPHLPARIDANHNASRLSLPLPPPRPVSPEGRFSPGPGHRVGSPHSRHFRESIDSTREDANRHSYYFRPPRSSTYSPSLSESSQHGRRSHLRVSTSIPASPLSPGSAGLITPLDTVPSVNNHTSNRSIGSIKSETGSRLNTLSSIASSTKDGPRSASSSRSPNHENSTTPTPILELTPATTVTIASQERTPESEAFSALVPRWNDYSFRESDLIYGGPGEGEFQTARAIYVDPTTVVSEDGKASTSDGRPSTTSSPSIRISDEDQSSQGFHMRDSSSSNRKLGAKSLARGGRKISSQLRQFSSSRLFNSSTSDGKPLEPTETGFSVRRPVVPEHILKAAAEAEAAAKAKAMVESSPNQDEAGGQS